MSLTRAAKKIIDDLENCSERELISIIEGKSVHQQVRYAAYLEMVGKGSLSSLQRLATDMDFSYEDEFGNDAFRMAAMCGRIDVMRWLCEYKKEFKNIDSERRIDIILLAVMNGRVDVLKELTRPTEAGGFGWNLNVSHKNGFSPVRMALKMRNFQLVEILLANKHDGGFGLPLEKSVLRSIKDKPEYAMYSGIFAPRYRRNRPGIRNSSVTLATLELGSNIPVVETYEPEKLLGKGGYGLVRLFASQKTPSKKIVVKQPAMPSSDEEPSGLDVLVDASDALLELTFLERAYPEDGPYKIKHFVINNGTGYDYRMVMPFIPGENIILVARQAKSIDELAKLLLAIAIEMQRIHDLGIVHGDPRPGNIIIETQRDESGAPTYKVRFIDFGGRVSANKGDRLGPYPAPRADIPPELCQDIQAEVLAHPSQDVFILGYYFNMVAKRYREFLADNYQSILYFCGNSTNKDPQKRPLLMEFIKDLQLEIVLATSKRSDERELALTIARPK